MMFHVLPSITSVNTSAYIVHIFCINFYSESFQWRFLLPTFISCIPKHQEWILPLILPIQNFQINHCLPKSFTKTKEVKKKVLKKGITRYWSKKIKEKKVSEEENDWLKKIFYFEKKFEKKSWAYLNKIKFTVATYILIYMDKT